MNYSPQSWLESRMMFGMKAGLENMRVVCERLGNPQKRLRTIHVVGTNGKGSTSFWIMRILQDHGLKAGLFTSPHLVSVRERIRIGDLAISEADFERILDLVRQASLDREITFFEVITAVALVWFAEQDLDAVILEAGLGGRLDSTNIVDSAICVLTSIGFDHMEILGNSAEEILMEKIGVWKKGAILFHNLPEKKMATLVNSQAVDRSAKAIEVPTDNALMLAQSGQVYKENASLSLAASKAFLGGSFQDSIALATLRRDVWPGRFQLLRNTESGAVEWILDGTHNGHAAQRLAESLQCEFPGQKFPLLVAILKTKDPREILEPLIPFVSEVIVTRTPHEKMREPGEIVKVIASFAPELPTCENSDVSSALKQASGLHRSVLCTGSLYFVGAVVENLKVKYPELVWFRQFSPTDNERK